MISYKKFSGQKFLREDTVMDHLDYDQEIWHGLESNSRLIGTCRINRYK